MRYQINYTDWINYISNEYIINKISKVQICINEIIWYIEWMNYIKWLNDNIKGMNYIRYQINDIRWWMNELYIKCTHIWYQMDES